MKKVSLMMMAAVCGFSLMYANAEKTALANDKISVDEVQDLVRIDIDQNTYIEFDQLYYDKVNVQTVELLKNNDTSKAGNHSRITSYKKGLVVSLSQQKKGSVYCIEKIRYGTYDEKSGQWQVTDWRFSEMNRKNLDNNWVAEYTFYHEK